MMADSCGACRGVLIICLSLAFVLGSHAEGSDGECGTTGGHCLGTTCCSQYGYCGSSSAYCGAGCQVAYGRCSTPGAPPPPLCPAVAGFTAYANQDSPGSDIRRVIGSVSVIAAACKADCRCTAFNTHGYLKTSSATVSTVAGVCLYKRSSNPGCAPPPATATCAASSYLVGSTPPQECNVDNGSECCVQGQKYPVYKCSPPVTAATQATLSLNGFGAGQDGGGESSCDGMFHQNTELVVALSTGWFKNRSRCLKKIIISARGKSVAATVVDECDTAHGCDAEHAYQPPCKNNIVDGSAAVWKALGISTADNQYGWMPVTWRDA